MPEPSPAVPHALGVVSAKQAQLLTVQFYDTPANPQQLRGSRRNFKLDLLAQTYKVGDVVVATWKRAPRTDASGALLVQGFVPTGGCHLRPITTAVKEPALQSWIQQSESQLRGMMEKQAGAPQGKPAGPDSTGLHKVFDPKTGATPPGAPASWTTVPVPVLGAEWEEAQPEGYVRIGYVSFTVDSPAEDIQIQEASPSMSRSTLRSRAPIQKGNWNAQQQVTLNLTLNGLDAINEVLLPLIRLFRKAPFLPVFNRLLHEVDITALALQDLQVSTIPGFPNALKVSLLCWSFNWECYLPMAGEFSGMDSLFCYPLLKIWAERQDKQEPNVFHPQKIDSSWDGRLHIYPCSEQWLKNVSEFPEAAAKAQRVNTDISSMQLATLWAGDTTGASLEGFGNTTTVPTITLGPILGGVGESNMRMLTAPVGRARVGGADWTFLTVRDSMTARSLASRPDEGINLLKGAVKINTDPDGDGSLNGAQFVDKGAFIHLIDDGDPVTIDYLQAGGYTFQVPMSSPIFATLARRTRVVPPLAPGDPLPDRTRDLIPPSLVVEQVLCSMGNVVTPLQVRGKRSAAHHYMGSTALTFQITGTMQSYDDAGQVKAFIDHIHDLGRQYWGSVTNSGKPFGGFAIVENELFRLMGVRHVLPISWSVSTLPDFPGALRFEATLVEFDATQRRKEVISDLMQGVTANKMLSVRSSHDTVGIDYLRQNDLNRRLRTVELYPDLGLPTYSELAQWLADIKNDQVWDWTKGVPHTAYEYLDPDLGGSGWQWSQQERVDAAGLPIAARLPDIFLNLAPPLTRPDRFADPDFYCAPAQQWGAEFVKAVVNGGKAQPFILHDSYGTWVQVQPGETIDENLVKTKGGDPQGALAKAQGSVEGGSHPGPIGASPSLVDDSLYGKLAGLTGVDKRPTPSQRVALGDALIIPNPPPGGDTAAYNITADDSGTLMDSYNRYAPIAAAAARSYKIPADLFFAQIQQESQWKSLARNKRSGAAGLVQFIPATAREFGVADPTNPVQNLNAAALKMHGLLQRYHGDERLALAAYNWGQGNLASVGNDITRAPSETQNYVAAITANRSRYVQNTSPGTPAYLASPEADPAVKAQTETVLKAFNSGFAYKVEDLAPYILPDITTTPDHDPLGLAAHPLTLPGGAVIPPGETAAQARARFIPAFWLKVSTTTQTVDNNAAATSYQIAPKYVPAFLAECKRRGLKFLPLVPFGNPAAPAGKYAYDAGVTSPGYAPPTHQQMFHDPVNGRDVFHDLREEMICGRLLGAFPTFYVSLVDGGRALRIWRMFDHLYGMQAITQIAVHRRRLGPVETAVVNFSNMYGHLTNQIADQARIDSLDTRTTWGLEAIYRGLASFVRIDDETLNEWAKSLDTIFLRPGARLHIRMGYGSDASRLPVVFNGVISEVPISEGEVQVVALSDGLELCNDLAPTNLQGSVPVVRLNSWLGEGVNPRELVMGYMAPTNTLGAVSNQAVDFVHALVGGDSTLGQAANLFYASTDNQYGIEHFGFATQDGLFQNDGEIGVNIYNAEHSAPVTASSAWDNSMRIMQFWRWDGNLKLIGINLAQATPWQIFEDVRKTIPDYILYAAPFELRSTLFMGKGWFPYFYRYREDTPEFTGIDPKTLEREQVMDYKPFQQVHLISSDWNLIGNDVRADSTDVVTQVQAIGTYAGWRPGSPLSNEASFVMSLDTDIYPEFQKLKVVESGIYTTFAMKTEDGAAESGGPLAMAGSALSTAVGVFTGDLPLTLAGLAGLFGGELRALSLSRRVEDYSAAATLKDYVKEMYQGCFTILGNGSIKPYDMLGVLDHLSTMNGLCETKAVTHTMSLETGFVSVVEPDLMATFMDTDGRDLYMWLAMTCRHLIAGLAVAGMTGHLSRLAANAALLRGVRRFSKWVTSALAKAESGAAPDAEFAGLTLIEARATEAELQEFLTTAETYTRVGNSSGVGALLNIIVNDSTYAKILALAPASIRFEIQAQHVLRALPSSKAGKLTAKLALQGAEKVKGVFTAGKDAASERLTQAAQAIAEKKAELGPDLGRVNDLLQKAKAGTALTAEEEKILALGKELQSLERQSKAAGIAASTLESVGTITNDLGEVLTKIGGQLFSRAGVFAAITAGVTVGAGCLVDYITRWAIARQCLTLYPLHLYDKPLVAGIDGHRGSVAGDRLGFVDEYIQKVLDWVSADTTTHTIARAFIPVLGDLVDAHIQYRAPELPAFFGDGTSTGPASSSAPPATR